MKSPAKIADLIEESRHTGAYLRVKALQATRKIEAMGVNEGSGSDGELESQRHIANPTEDAMDPVGAARTPKQEELIQAQQALMRIRTKTALTRIRVEPFAQPLQAIHFILPKKTDRKRGLVVIQWLVQVDPLPARFTIRRARYRRKIGQH